MQHFVIMGGQPYGLGLEEKLLPQYLKDLGYVTRAVGKVHVYRSELNLLSKFLKSLYIVTWKK